MLMPKVVNNVDICRCPFEFHYCEKHVGNSHNPFAGKRMGRHTKRQNQIYLRVCVRAVWVRLRYGLRLGLGCRLGRRLVYERMMKDHKENNKRGNTSIN